MQRPAISLARFPAARQTRPAPRQPPPRPDEDRPPVRLLKYPHPYAAMMAICSDLDATPSQQTYWEVCRFLNTRLDTPMGPGLGLEVGNSMYFYAPGARFGYWLADEKGRRMIRALIASGHIDCLHSYGAGATRRAHAQRAIEELNRHGCRLKVWVDHSHSPTNLGPDVMSGQGDVVTSPAYHADLTLDYGIRYVWRGRTSGLIGQDAALGCRLFGQMYEPAHRLRCGWTLLKEAAKVCLGRMDRPRWRMHAANAVLRPGRLRDGQGIWEFMRADWYWGGQGRAANAASIHQVLTQPFLELLCRRRAACVWYTHLNKSRDPDMPFGPPAQAALRLLARYNHQQKVLVTTTHRLLRYLTVRDHLRYHLEAAPAGLVITIEFVDDPVFGPYRPSVADLAGITFVTPPGQATQVRFADGAAVPCRIGHGPKTTYVTVPWQRLVFPNI